MSNPNPATWVYVPPGTRASSAWRSQDYEHEAWILLDPDNGYFVPARILHDGELSHWSSDLQPTLDDAKKFIERTLTRVIQPRQSPGNYRVTIFYRNGPTPTSYMDRNTLANDVRTILSRMRQNLAPGLGVEIYDVQLRQVFALTQDHPEDVTDASLQRWVSNK